jgi:hypothetical protein
MKIAKISPFHARRSKSSNFGAKFDLHILSFWLILDSEKSFVSTNVLFSARMSFLVHVH